MPSVVPDIAELFEEAYERAGLEMRSGYDLRTIRRSLNILTLEWANRGLNLFTIEAGTQALTAGVSSYVMPSDTIDLIEHRLRTGTGVSQTDTYLERISVSSFAEISNKNLSGRPTQIYIQRLPTSTVANLWPVPDGSYTLYFQRLKGIDGVSTGIGGQTQMIPPRFVPSLTAGLAYYIAMKKPELAARLPMLKQEYEEQFDRAAGEDRDRSSITFYPDAWQ
jgi:hypothetical protein